ncbi:MAG: tetratricopeptide repeat protein [Bacteroidetes bacterium]|nr:tetratricopeptide repeat protein [Bacteroidota bacterium]
MRFIFKTTIIFFLGLSAALAQDIEMANLYFKQGEYEKAAELYKKISANKDQARIIHSNYLLTLTRLQDYDSAEKFLKSQIKYNENNIVYRAEIININELKGKAELASKDLEELIDMASKNDGWVYELQTYFYKTNKLDLAVKLLLKGRERSKDPNKFDTQLARAYLYLDMKDKMLEEVLNFGYRAKNFDYVQATIQDNIKTDKEIEMLENILYARIQTNPEETYYSEILIWHFTQKSDFARAFIQARAIDQRQKLQGFKIFELAGKSFTSADYKNAVRMYQYIMTEYPEGELYPYARKWMIQSKEELVKNTFPIDNEQIKELINQYNQLIADIGINPKSVEVLKNMALLHAFYLHDYDKAIEILETAITASGNNQKFKDECKLNLGDIFILKEEPWESTLLYMQVEKSQKEDQLAEIAKLKNARLQYYTGQFELSKEILDVLKKATTREIANDAMQLSLLIQDNTGLDTSEVAMKEFAAIDLLIFQNKYTQSIQALSKLFIKYKTHSLADEILWLKANTLLKINKIDEAVKDLNTIIENYKYDILADDALFTLAKVTEENLKDKEKAMNLYRSLLKDYPGSIYASQARVRFRELRGDYVN